MTGYFLRGSNLSGIACYRTSSCSYNVLHVLFYILGSKVTHNAFTLMEGSLEMRLLFSLLLFHPLPLCKIMANGVGVNLVYRARPSLPRVVLLSHALNYKRVWRGGREGLAEVISIHEALTNQITVQNPCHLGASIVSRSSCQVDVMKTN